MTFGGGLSGKPAALHSLVLTIWAHTDVICKEDRVARIALSSPTGVTYGGFTERERGPLGTLVNRWVPRGLLGPSVPTDRHEGAPCLSFSSVLFCFLCTNCYLSSGYVGGPRNRMCNGPLAYPCEDI